MAETLISPGVSAREQDTSFRQPTPVNVGFAIIGPTTKGPIQTPLAVSSYANFTSIFGSTVESGSESYRFLTDIAVQDYFSNSTEPLLVTRVVPSASEWSPATSSLIEDVSGSEAFVLETLDSGVIMNSSSSESAGGSLADGTKDNLRWEIDNVNPLKGTFTLVIRRGNDNTRSKNPLETFNNLSLDPQSSDYIKRKIGNQTFTYNSAENYIKTEGEFANISQYVRVKEVTNKTPNYLDGDNQPQAGFSDLLPITQSGSFGGATGQNFYGEANFYHKIDEIDSQGLKGSDYDDMISLLTNKDNYKFSLISTPGLINESHSTQITSLISNAETRGDHMVVVDPVKYDATVIEVTAQAITRDSSYASMYWPWVKMNLGELGDAFVPASTIIPGVYAFSTQPWFAPAGLLRGATSALEAERKLSQGQRDTLYENKVNPIATFPGVANPVIYGNKTLQTRASALDRVNVRRLLIELKSFISQVALNLVFEQNTTATRNSFLSQVNPYLENIQQQQGLFAFRVIMDDSNNTNDVIDRNELIGQIYVQPTRTAEFIYLDFVVQPTGATFPD